LPRASFRWLAAAYLVQTGPLGRADALGRNLAIGPPSLEQMKVVALGQKHTADDPAVAPADEVLDLAWGRRSPLLGGTPLEPGQPADFLLVTPDVPELSVGDVDAGLVYAANGSAVDTTVVDGRVLMRHRLVDGLDEAIDEVRHRAARLTT
jgi:5-methylthioadenosine/S-adenosylhomocysteine deaminase